MIELLTRRTCLSPFAETDVSELLELFRDPGVRRYLLDDRIVADEWILEEIDESCQRFEASGAGLWAVRLRTADGIIGFAGYRAFFDPPQLQLLYGLLPEFWKRGLATEAAARVCAHGFDELGFDRIDAAIDAPNKDSARVLRRLGFRQTRETPDGTRFFSLRTGDLPPVSPVR